MLIRLRKFSALEIFSTGALLLIAVYFLINNYQKIFLSDQARLEKRYQNLVSLLNQGNYSDAYEYLDSSNKSATTKADFVKSYEGGNTTQTITINDIIIEDGIGYVDRYDEVCEGNDCYTVRGYKKWIYENDNWYYSPPNPRCIRKEMYDMPPEFSRALGLLKQRFIAKGISKDADFDFYKCLDIQYSNLNDDVEGLFFYDPSASDIDKQTIYVKNSYMYKDDLLTAYLLSHEITHVKNNLSRINYDSTIDCYDDEIDAFVNQMLFLSSLNEGESDSLVARVASREFFNDPTIYSISTMIDLSTQASRQCGGVGSCYNNTLTQQIIDMVRNSPYYQEQCSISNNK